MVLTDRGAEKFRQSGMYTGAACAVNRESALICLARCNRPEHVDAAVRHTLHHDHLAR